MWHGDGLWASRLADARRADQPEVRERKGWARLARLARQRDSEIGSHIGILHAASAASPFAHQRVAGVTVRAVIGWRWRAAVEALAWW